MRKLLAMVVFISVILGTDNNTQQTKLELDPPWMVEMVKDHPTYYAMPEEDQAFLVKCYTVYHY